MMKHIKWKTMIISSIVCLLPILLGISLWEKLPDTMAIHFDINNTPDNFASKGFVVFGLPLFMVAMQIFSCIVYDINPNKKGENEKIERVTKWIIPFVTVILYVVTLAYGLGKDLDIRRIAVIIVGIIFIVTGNYLPKSGYIKNYNLEVEKARKINRFTGFSMVIMGILFLISLFLPPVASVVCILLLIPYTIIGVIYGIKVGRK